jgi:diguanylate cyclase (GGDEF)-like protein
MNRSRQDTHGPTAFITAWNRLIVIGHWSVTAKLLGLVAPLLILSVLVFVRVFAGRQFTQRLEEQTTLTAEALLAQIRAEREYYATTIVPRLTAIQAPLSPDYQHVPNSFPVPATVLREVTAMIAQSPLVYRVNLISPWPINKQNSIRDAFQEEGFKTLLTTNASLVKRLDRLNGITVMRFLAPDRAIAPSCVSCHNAHPQSPKKDFKPNELMGAIEISIPIETALQAAHRDQLWLMAGGISLSVLVMALMAWGLRLVVTQPVRELTARVRNLASASSDITEKPDISPRTEQVMGEEIRQLWHGFWELYLSFRREQQARAADLAQEAAATQRLNQRLVELQRVTQAIQQAISEEEVYRILCHTLQQSAPLQQILILRLNASEDRLEIVWSSPKREDLAIESYPVWNEPHRCPVIRSGREFTVQDTARDLTCPASLSNQTTGGYWCVPLVIGGRTIGVVHLVSHEPNRWTTDTAQWIEALVNVAAPMIGHLQHLERAKRRALIDELTGTYNRRFLEETLSKLIVPDDRRRGQVVSLLVIDLDHFKHINDTYGHQVGDLVLKTVAQTLHRSLKASDILARYGGEEFVVVLPQTDTAGALAVGERLRALVAALSLRKLAPLAPERVTISIGVATYPTHASTAAELLRAADEALYQSKTQGRNRVTCASHLLEAGFRKGSTQDPSR